MFERFKKKKKEEPIKFYPEEEYADAIEESLWEIKEEYDLPTEEDTDLVYSKRKNLNYLYECIKNNKSYYYV